MNAARPMASVTFEGIGKRYGDRPVIEGFDLEVRAGELMVLLGPSGCGKSTLLRMVAGLETPSAGVIRIGDRVVNDLPPRDRDVSMVFQSYALYPHMTVRENLAFGLEMRRVARADRDRLVNEAAQVLGLGDLLERTPRQLSGGQRQRVAVGRAIVRKPAVFLFDEPLSNLDAKLRLQTRSEIGRLQRELGTTTIYVTHDQVEAMTLGHRIALLDAGRLQQCGPPLELYERPANRFVAGFLGSPAMNFFPAVAGADGALVGPGYRFVLSAAARASSRVEPGAAVTVGIRPEHLARVHDPAAPAAGFVEGEVDLVEPLGSTVVVYLRVGDLRVATLAGGAGPPAVGERLRLVPEPEKLHLFGVRS